MVLPTIRDKIAQLVLIVRRSLISTRPQVSFGAVEGSISLFLWQWRISQLDRCLRHFLKHFKLLEICFFGSSISGSDKFCLWHWYSLINDDFCLSSGAQGSSGVEWHQWVMKSLIKRKSNTPRMILYELRRQRIVTLGLCGFFKNGGRIHSKTCKIQTICYKILRIWFYCFRGVGREQDRWMDASNGRD